MFQFHFSLVFFSDKVSTIYNINYKVGVCIRIKIKTLPNIHNTTSMTIIGHIMDKYDCSCYVRDN